MDINKLFRKRNDDLGSLFGGKAQTETAGRYQKQIGERHEFILTCTDVIPLTSGYSVKIYKFVDDLGNVVVNFANKDGDWFAGNKYKIRATVKAHKIYDGVRQTHIIRLKTLELFYDQPPAVATACAAWDEI